MSLALETGAKAGSQIYKLIAVVPNLVSGTAFCRTFKREPERQTLEGESFGHKTTPTEQETRLDIKSCALWECLSYGTFLR